MSCAPIVIAAALAAMSSPAFARPDPATTPPPPQMSAHAPETLEQSAARVVARLALADLRVVGTPAESDYQIAATMIESAHALAPKDDAVLRQLIEAQENAGNSGRVIELTRELIKLDPLDTVAQLRLISAGIRNLQNADDRLAAYDRWLGKEGASIDPSVLSRLALDAALLAREKGDAPGFATRLGRSIALDSTNKDAATLALAYYTQRVGEPVGQFELMLAVLNADPLDSDLHQAIARHLAAQGAYKGAARFFNTFAGLLTARGAQPPIEEVTEIELIRWRLEGPRSLVERYDRSIFEARQGVRRQREQAAKDNKPLDALPTPEQHRLPMAAEWVRFLAAKSIDDAQLIDNAFAELIESARQESEELSSAEARPKEMSEDEATARIRGLLEESTCARLLAGKQPDKVAEGLDILRADAAVDRDKLANLEGLNLLQKGDADGAERLVEARADSDPAAALARCLVLEQRSQGPAATDKAKADAAGAYAALSRREADSLPGAFASARYQVLTGKPLAPDANAKRLDELAAGVPAWLENFVHDPRRIQALDVSLIDSDVKALDPVRMKVTLRNVSPIPLGVGPDCAINSRMVIAPQVQVGTDSIKTGTLLNVISMERRLRLPARAEFSAIILADSPTLSLLLEQVSGRMCRVRYRVLQGFEAVSPTSYDAGPHCLVAECGPVRREVLPKSTADVPALVRFAETGSARDVAEAVLVAIGRMLPDLGMTPLTPDELASLFAAAAKRLPDLPTPGQLLVLSIMPVQGQMKEVAPVDEAARAITDPAVRSLFIATRARTADDAVFADAASRATPALAQFSDLVQRRLQSGVACIATYTSEPQPSQPLKDKGGSAVQPDK